jgi:hypothetical protein
VYLLILIPFLILFPAQQARRDQKHGQRLKCLQSKFRDHTWIQGFITNSSPKTWLFESHKCPLLQFDEEKFCKIAVGCGKKVLVVGDSTMSFFFSSSRYLLSQESESESSCPSEGTTCPIDQGRRSDKILTNHGCYSEPHNESIRTVTVCGNYCPLSQPVTMTFIRHDFLNNVHGQWWFKSNVCQHWWTEVSSSDIVILSSGPHVTSMVTHPYTKRTPPGFDIKSLFQNESQIIGKKLDGLLKKNAVVIYRTGPPATSNFSRDCHFPPLSSPPPIESHPEYYWELIPVMNDIYISTLRRILARRLLVLNTYSIESQYRGCRRDPMHYMLSSLTPQRMEWLIIYNQLLEYTASRRGIYTWLE